MSTLQYTGRRFGAGARRAADGMLVRSPLQQASLHRGRSRLCVLAYQGTPEPHALGAQLDWLVENTNVVSLGDVRRHLFDGQALPERPVLVTIDDCEPSVVEVAAPLLSARGVPAVAFVVPGVVDTKTPFWWVEVSELVRAGGGDDATAAALVRRLKSVPDDERELAVQDLRERSGTVVSTRQLSRGDLRELERHGVDVGNHSWSHPCLDRCDDATLRHEVGTARQWLTTALGHPPLAFAYPNGNWDNRVRAAIRTAGHDLAFTFDHRLVGQPVDPLAVSRVRADSSASLDRFRILVSGLHPSLHRLRAGV